MAHTVEQDGDQWLVKNEAGETVATRDSYSDAEEEAARRDRQAAAVAELGE